MSEQATVPLTGEAEPPASEVVAEPAAGPVEPPPPAPVSTETASPARDDQVEEAERGRPVGQWVAGGGLGLGLTGLTAWSAFGPVGLAAAAVTAVGGGLVYTVYKLKARNGRRSAALLGGRGRSAGHGRRSSSRLGQTGLGRGRGGRIFGGKGGLGLGKRGRGAGLGGRVGRKGSGGGRGLLGGKGARLGRAGLGRGRAGASRLGMTGRGASRSGSRTGGRGVLGRAGRGGLGLGARGGRLLGGKGRAGLGRWSKSTGGGAGILSKGLGKAARRTGRLAARTRPGRRAISGFRAARAALASGGTGGGRWRMAHRAARSALRTPRVRYRSWEVELGAALLALTALLHRRWKARQARKNPTTTTTTTTTTTSSTTTSTGHGPPRTTTTTTTTTTASTTASATTTAAGQLTGPVLDPPALTAGPIPYPHHRRRSTRVSTYPILSAAAELNAVAASYAPENPFVIARELDQLPDVTDHVALAIRTYTQRLDNDYPLHPAVIQKLQEVYAAQAQLRSLAEEVGPLYRQVHAKDLERAETPRNNEHLWDVRNL